MASGQEQCAASAVMRPPHPAAMAPVWALPVSRHTNDFSTRPPSRGSPGTRLRTPTRRLAAASPSTARQQQPVGRDEPQPDRCHTDRQGGERSDHRDRELLAGRPRLPLDRGHAAEEMEGDRVHREAVAAGHHRVRGLVQQHRPVEHHREGQPGDVLPGAETWLHLLDPGGHDHRDQAGDQEPRRRDQYVGAGDGADLERAGRPGARGWSLLRVGHAPRLSERALSVASPSVRRRRKVMGVQGVDPVDTVVEAAVEAVVAAESLRPRLTRRRSTGSTSLARSHRAGPATS